MIIDIIIDDKVAMTLSQSSIEFLLKEKDSIDIPVTLEEKEITLRFRKTEK